MTKYHVNPDTGRVNICRAQSACRYGESQHGSTKEEARQAYENLMQEETVPDPFEKALRKITNQTEKGREMNRVIDYNARMRDQLAQGYEEKRGSVTVIHEAATVEELEAYNESFRKLESELNEEEKKAFHDYTGLSFFPLNAYLSNPDYLNEGPAENVESRKAYLEKLASQLDTALAKAPQQERTLYRRIDQEGTKELISSEDWVSEMGYVVGQKLQYPSFSSTTIDPAYIGQTVSERDEHTSVVLSIKTSKGAPVGLTSTEGRGTYTQENEREILLPRKVPMQVTKIEREGYPDRDGNVFEVVTVSLEEIN